MNNSNRFRNVFNKYYDETLNERETFQLKEVKIKYQRNKVKRLAIAFASFMILLSGTTLVGAATGWFNISNIFRDDTKDPISAELVDGGKVQVLDIIKENDEYKLRLIAFTGDVETHKAMLELTPKVDLGEISNMSLYGQTFSPSILENGDTSTYMFSEFKGVYNEEKKVYYFNYKLPPYWVKGSHEDVILHVKGINIYDEKNIPKYLEANMNFRFSPDKSILEAALKIPINQLVTKTVYQDQVGFTDNYDNPYAYTGEIVAPTKEISMKITDVMVSNYITEVKALFEDESLTFDEARNYWNQFTEKRYLVNHYHSGIENKVAYNISLVENTERFRLYVDDVEREVNEESLFWQPGKGPSEDGNPETEEKFGCSIEFESFDYESAQKVEVHFGEQIIKLK